MARLLLLLVVAWGLAASRPLRAEPSLALDPGLAARFAGLALSCVEREYPNKLAHVLVSDADVLPPRRLTPAFFGCFDWHSAVHGHWLLVRLLRRYPTAAWAAAARAVLERHLSRDSLAAEVAYLRSDGRSGFERPYGLAWLLQLSAELDEWDSPEARRWSAALAPLSAAAVERLASWLPKLTRPVRSGEHSQTAFALGLLLDWARRPGAARQPFLALLSERARHYFLADRDCPLAYEPSGEDFLSPCLAEADVLRRLLPQAEFADWLDRFLPPSALATLQPAVVSDRSDGKLVHLDGLNLSRAWMLDGIAGALPSGRQASELRRLATAHRVAGVAALRSQSYEGGHWLGSFATYLLTGRGLAN